MSSEGLESFFGIRSGAALGEGTERIEYFFGFE